MRLPRQYERREQHALSRPTGILYNVQQAHVKEGLKHDDLHPSAVVCPDVDKIKHRHCNDHLLRRQDIDRSTSFK